MPLYGKGGYGAHCVLHIAACTAKAAKIVGAQERLGPLLHTLQPNWVAILIRIAQQKRIPNGTVVQFIYIFFLSAAVPGVKIKRNLSAVQYRNILGQHRIQRSHHTITGNGQLCLKTDKITICVHTAVCAGAALYRQPRAKHLFYRVLEHFLHGNGIFLHLPAVVVCAVISNV